MRDPKVSDPRQSVDRFARTETMQHHVAANRPLVNRSGLAPASRRFFPPTLSLGSQCEPDFLFDIEPAVQAGREGAFRIQKAPVQCEETRTDT